MQRLTTSVSLAALVFSGIGCIAAESDWQCHAEKPCPSGELCVAPQDLPERSTDATTDPACFKVCSVSSDCDGGNRACLEELCVLFDDDCSSGDCPEGFFCNAIKLCEKYPASGGCGNGHLDAGEVCDDGNNEDGDGCSANCRSDESCGNEVVDLPVGEECDEGATGSRFCDPDCTLPECGDGVGNTEAGEQCDTSGASSTCDADCTLPVCGDGAVNQLAGEECDGTVGVHAACLECTVVCEAGWFNCDGDIAGSGCPVHLSDDVMNCGACGRYCGADSTCTEGTCAPVRIYGGAINGRAAPVAVMTETHLYWSDLDGIAYLPLDAGADSAPWAVPGGTPTNPSLAATATDVYFIADVNTNPWSPGRGAGTDIYSYNPSAGTAFVATLPAGLEATDLAASETHVFTVGFAPDGIAKRLIAWELASAQWVTIVDLGAYDHRWYSYEDTLEIAPDGFLYTNAYGEVDSIIANLWRLDLRSWPATTTFESVGWRTGYLTTSSYSDWHGMTAISWFEPTDYLTKDSVGSVVWENGQTTGPFGRQGWVISGPFASVLEYQPPGFGNVASTLSLVLFDQRQTGGASAGTHIGGYAAGPMLIKDGFVYYGVLDVQTWHSRGSFPDYRYYPKQAHLQFWRVRLLPE